MEFSEPEQLQKGCRSVVDGGGGMPACCITRQLFTGTDNGWPHNALRESLARAKQLPLPRL